MTILYPLDLLKRRLMIQGHGDSAVKYRNGFHAAQVIVREEGVVGLYRGIWPSYLKVIPTVSITWLTYEVMKKYLGISKKTSGAAKIATPSEASNVPPVVAAPKQDDNDAKR